MDLDALLNHIDQHHAETSAKIDGLNEKVHELDKAVLITQTKVEGLVVSHQEIRNIISQNGQSSPIKEKKPSRFLRFWEELPDGVKSIFVMALIMSIVMWAHDALKSWLK